MEWTSQAQEKLKEIPFFVRPAARKKIEKFAKENDITTITVEVYEQAKAKFNQFQVTWGVSKKPIQDFPSQLQLELQAEYDNQGRVFLRVFSEVKFNENNKRRLADYSFYVTIFLSQINKTVKCLGQSRFDYIQYWTQVCLDA